MQSTTPSVVNESTAISLASSLCHGLQALISDYGILAGTFPQENPKICDSFSSRGFSSGTDLMELEDKARTLKSRIMIAEKREEYGEAARKRHDEERQEISMSLVRSLEKLKNLKEHQEANCSFKYLPGCSYLVLGELGTPHTEPSGPTRGDQVPPSRSAMRLAASKTVQFCIQPMPEKKIKKSVSAPAGLNQSELAQSPDKTSGRPIRDRVRKPPQKFPSKDIYRASSKSKPTPRAKSTRTHRRVTMGIAKRIANTRLKPGRFSFGYLAPHIRTPQQLWGHLYPASFRKGDPQE